MSNEIQSSEPITENPPRPATAAERFGATLLDLILFMVPAMFVAMTIIAMRLAAGDLPRSNESAIEGGSIWPSLLAAAAWAAYEIVGVRRFGCTIGKLAFRLRVTTDPAKVIKPTTQQSVLRHMAKTLQPLVLLVGFAAAGFATLGQVAWFIALLVLIAQHPAKRGLHDRYSNTYVLKV